MAMVRLIEQTADMTIAEVTFDGHYSGITTITHATHIVVDWVNDVFNAYAPLAGVHGRVSVGLHIEFSVPYNGIDLLQLCVGHRCLVYQLRYRDEASPPVRLNDFLNDDRFCFVGVNLWLALWMLRLGHGLRVWGAIDLGDKASRMLEREDLRSAGLHQLVREVMGIEIFRPDRAQRNALLQRVLPLELVAHACIDVIFSHELGRILFS